MERLIDSIKYYFEKHIEQSNNEVDCVNACEAICRYVRDELTPISVEKEIPPIQKGTATSINVLIYTEVNGWYIGFYSFMDGIWFDEYRRELTDYNPTHWIYLPERPVEKDDHC